MLVAFVGVLPMFGVGPLAHGGLDKTLGLAVSSGCVGTGCAVLDSELEALAAKEVGSIAASVVGEQCADRDSVSLIEVDGVTEKVEGRLGLLIWEYLSKGEAGVVVDSDVKSFGSWVLMKAASAPVGTQ
jgi:hypothetical protein